MSLFPHTPRPLQARPVVFAHRGGAALRPENTMIAFEHGLRVGADGLELDVRLSSDGIAIVHHDPTVDRVTDGRGAVEALSAQQLASLDAAHAFQAGDGRPYRGRGVGIPRLRDVLDAFPHVPMIVELKGDDPGVAHAAVRDVRDASALDRVCFGGFSRRVLAAARAAGAAITSAARGETRWALYRSWIGLPPPRPAYRAFQVPERSGRTTVVTPRFLRVVRSAGLAVHVWTVDAPEDIRRLRSWGVDGVITDRPDVAAAVLRESAASRT